MVNVIVMAGDHIVSGVCNQAINTSGGESIWPNKDYPSSTLVASCTHCYFENKYEPFHSQRKLADFQSLSM